MGDGGRSLLVMVLLSTILLSEGFHSRHPSRMQSESSRFLRPIYHRHYIPKRPNHGHISPPFNSKLATSTSTALPMFLPSSSAAAATALLLSSTTGCLMDRFLPNSGILITLSVAAALSNLGLVPSSHALYDVSWTLFLPASLAFLLLSSSSNNAEHSSNDPSTIRNVGIPFALGSFGSILGCVLSFFICHQWPTLWLSPCDAAMAAGCLCASYIGGSVNFFATANVLLAANDRLNPSSGGASSLLGSMAAADLIVMALYFALMATAARNATVLQTWFGGARNPVTPTANDIATPASDSEPSKLATDKQTMVQTILATALVSVSAWAIVQIANRVERTLAPIVPGTGCAIIAILASTRLGMPNRFHALWRRMQSIGSSLSQLCFHLLFASIGTSANVGSALSTGPACLYFSLFALSVHIVLTLTGSLILQRRAWCSQLQWEHVLVASNAAIGGPATAAAFASTLPPQRGLTMAATLWGVVGYAVATGIGVVLARMLQTFVR